MSFKETLIKLNGTHDVICLQVKMLGPKALQPQNVQA